ncbi:hypothetical protein HPB49_024623 [Dermacentor silvarum]|uniref:Uncharacterized protein n=1 Tax=Dermacentor silvarum TaxID=543639 RepID=A0ACB8CIJ8_DERSI|nr:hypothetical protein HPB49_024623 [Dermacentor silvarum]
MKLTEEAGFRIVRIVTDNHQTNVSLFKSLSDDGTLSHVVTHPVRVGDPLFLSFDQNHLIKNPRNNFLERELLDEDQLIKGGVYMKKLFEIQSQLLVKPHREPFYATDDERLLWLEVDFINYIEDLQLSGSRSKQKITKETYEATLLTTRSTVAVIEYLLDHANCLRQFNGGNDRVDARAAVFSVERLLKVGILHAAKTGNAPSSSESNAAVSVPSQDNDVPSCPVEIKHAARELSGELECVNYCAQAQDELEIE